MASLGPIQRLKLSLRESFAGCILAGVELARAKPARLNSKESLASAGVLELSLMETSDSSARLERTNSSG